MFFIDSFGCSCRKQYFIPTYRLTMASSPSLLSFCSACSFPSGLNSSRDSSSVKEDVSYADVVRGSSKVVHASMLPIPLFRVDFSSGRSGDIGNSSEQKDFIGEGLFDNKGDSNWKNGDNTTDDRGNIACEKVLGARKQAFNIGDITLKNGENTTVDIGNINREIFSVLVIIPELI